jgi:hypothetical protein
VLVTEQQYTTATLIEQQRKPITTRASMTDKKQEPEIARTTEPIPKISADMSAQEAVNVYLRFMKESTGSRA